MAYPRIAILGDGGWGTTLSLVLEAKGYPVCLWGAFKDYATVVNKKRVNTKFLPGIKIPREIMITAHLERAIAEKDIIIVAIPSEYVRAVLKKVRKLSYPKEALYLSVTKGIETGSLKRVSQIIREELRVLKIAVLSGPTIAHEVALGMPTSAVVSSRDLKINKYLQCALMTERFRIYTNNDMVGVELGGSLKNVIAIACGMSDGLGFGTNSKAALLARGLVEISRLGQAMGAKAKTFSGLSGLGDLVTTCISSFSRNRFVGLEIGKGRPLKDVKRKMQMVAEGLPTTKSAYELSLKYKVEMPITAEVYNVLYKNKPPLQAVRDLMTRQKKAE